VEAVEAEGREVPARFLPEEDFLPKEDYFHQVGGKLRSIC
jgi:hypothetical protein